MSTKYKATTTEEAYFITITTIGWIDVFTRLNQKYNIINPNWNPYNYTMQNPVNLVDPDGMQAREGDDWYENKSTGEIRWYDGNVSACTDENGVEWRNTGLSETFDNVDIGGKSTSGYVSSSGKHMLIQFSIDDVINENKDITVKNNSTTFNKDKAVGYLDKKAFPSYSSTPKSEVGRCGYYVRMALEAGGINTNSHPVPARLYGSYLKNWGFSKVNTDKFERGDIAVFQGYPGATADKNGVPYGHIQIYNGNQWMAVWHQNGFWPGRGYSVNKASFEIYRWNK